MAPAWVVRSVLVALIVSILAMCLVGYEANDEATCEDMLSSVSIFAQTRPTASDIGVDTTLGMLRDQCPAEYKLAKERLKDAGYLR